MSRAGHCERCGAAIPPGAPGGACPACLLSHGLSTSGAATAPFEPPSLDALRAQFPQLEILELLGRGGMGAVYKARQPRLDRHVALKILPIDPGRNPEFSQRFLREAQALARLSHPHIVTLHDFGETGELAYFIMEYLKGHDLKQRLDRGPLPPREAVEIARAVCDALQYAHGEGVVHRDIKPANILLDQAGRVKIADFGLARLLAPDSPDLTLTLSNESMGTPYYMAPEQRTPAGSVDHRADLYALGVVLYEMLTGELPLGSFDPPSRKCPVNPRVDDIVLRALKADPALRYPDAGTLKADLDRLLSTSVASQPSRPLRVRIALAAAALLLAGAAVGGWFLTRTARSVLPQDVVEFGGNYYKVYYENIGWHEARRRCERMGGRLAIVNSQAEDEFLAAISRSHVWLGATDEHKEGEWVWVDGTPVTYSNWDHGEPNNAVGRWTWDASASAGKPRPGEHCLMMSKYARWNDLDAESSIINGFICEWEGARFPAPRRIATAEDLHAALKTANPGYNGKGVFKTRDGSIREAVLLHAGVTNLAPLKGLPLASLTLSWAEVSDLGPLDGMPLARLDLSWSSVADLAPLAGIPLTELRLDGSRVRDLSPLRGMPLTYLDISHTKVTDLGPLAGMPLAELHMNCVKATDLTPLAGMPLRKLGLLDVPAADLAPLATCTNLESLVVPVRARNIERLRELPLLKLFNNKPPEEFWSEFSPATTNATSPAR